MTNNKLNAYVFVRLTTRTEHSLLNFEMYFMLVQVTKNWKELKLSASLQTIKILTWLWGILSTSSLTGGHGRMILTPRPEPRRSVDDNRGLSVTPWVQQRSRVLNSEAAVVCRRQTGYDCLVAARCSKEGLVVGAVVIVVIVVIVFVVGTDLGGFFTKTLTW